LELTVIARAVLVMLICLFLGADCTSKPKAAQLSGKVTFRGRPVPAGYISFAPDVANGSQGQIRVLQIKDGSYDSAKEAPPGINPGPYFLRIAGFDGKRIPYFGRGKQIFNEWKDIEFTIPEGASTKDFEVPSSLGENVHIQRTADT
jgi:hypothetical protein